MPSDEMVEKALTAWYGAHWPRSFELIDRPEQIRRMRAALAAAEAGEPVGSGTTTIDVDDGAGNRVYVEFGPGDCVHLYRDNEGDKWERVCRAGNPELQEQIEKAFAFVASPPSEASRAAIRKEAFEECLGLLDAQIAEARKFDADDSSRGEELSIAVAAVRAKIQP